MQAAIGCAQFKKLPAFIAARRKNAAFYLERLAQYEEHIIMPDGAIRRPTRRGSASRSRSSRTSTAANSSLFLEEAKIETRLVFAGNVLKQPGFENIPRRVHGELTGTDTIMNQTLFIGVYPGLTDEMLEFVADRIGQFFKARVRRRPDRALLQDEGVSPRENAAGSRAGSE